MSFISWNKSVVMAIIVFLSLVLSGLTNDYRFLYLMAFGLIVTAVIFDNNRRKNIWKFIVGFLVLVVFIYSLYNFI